MKTKINTRPIIIRPSEVAPDPASIQAGVDRHLASRLGVSLALAGTFAALAGLGPQVREARQ
jgi:hypothetical protein